MRNTIAGRLLVAAALLIGFSATTYAQDACDATSFKGAFGYKLTGSYYDSNYYVYLIGAVGRLVSDGSGAITATDTFNNDGSASKRQLTGTYVVNEDCTGSLILSGSGTFVTHADFVIMNDGKEISLVQTDSGIILTGELKLQKQTAPAATPAAPTQ